MDDATRYAKKRLQLPKPLVGLRFAARTGREIRMTGRDHLTEDSAIVEFRVG